jgi:hypothetical protein
VKTFNIYPYRLNSIDNKPPTISEKDQNLTCTSFNKVKTVYEPTSEDYSMELFYGVDHNRMKQVIYNNNSSFGVNFGNRTQV